MQIRNALPGEPEHHFFLQQTKLRAWFETKGIDIDKYVVKITPGEHDAIQRFWNHEWLEFQKNFPNATGQQIVRQVGKKHARTACRDIE